jgi:hypothetical protein
MDEKTLDSLISYGRQTKTRSNILTSLLCISAFSIPILLIAFNFSSAAKYRDILVGLAIFLIFIPILIYIYWTFKDPDRLHSEKFLIQKQELQSRFMLQQSTNSEPIIISDGNITSNPNNNYTNDNGGTI